MKRRDEELFEIAREYGASNSVEKVLFRSGYRLGQQEKELEIKRLQNIIVRAKTHFTVSGPVADILCEVDYEP